MVHVAESASADDNSVHGLNSSGDHVSGSAMTGMTDVAQREQREE